jgi:hypothetical protein
MKTLKNLFTKIILSDRFIKLFIYLSAFVFTIFFSIEF